MLSVLYHRVFLEGVLLPACFTSSLVWQPSVPTLCDALECLLYDTKIVLCTYCSDLAAGWLIISKPNLAVVNLYCWFFFLLQPYPISENWVSFGFVLLMPTSHQVQESHRVSSTCICMHQSCSVLILRFLTVQIKEDWLLYLLFVVQGTSPWRCTSPGVQGTSPWRCTSPG